MGVVCVSGVCARVTSTSFFGFEANKLAGLRLVIQLYAAGSASILKLIPISPRSGART